MIRHRARLLGGVVLLVGLVLAGCSASRAGTATATSAPAPAPAPVVLIQTSQGLGSGIVDDAKGDVVINDHVVAGAGPGGFQVTLANGKQYPARLVGAFAPDDLAVLHVQAAGLQPAGFADSSKLQVGDVALAIGNPLGLRSSVTEGIVSALGRTVNEEGGSPCPAPSRPAPRSTRATRAAPWSTSRAG